MRFLRPGAGRFQISLRRCWDSNSVSWRRIVSLRRKVYPQVPPKVGIPLNRLGVNLYALALDAILKWADRRRLPRRTPVKVRPTVHHSRAFVRNKCRGQPTLSTFFGGRPMIQFGLCVDYEGPVWHRHIRSKMDRKPVDLHDNSFIAGFCEVIPKRWLCVEAAGAVRAFSFAGSNLSPYPDMARCPEITVRHPVVAMGSAQRCVYVPGTRSMMVYKPVWSGLPFKTTVFDTALCRRLPVPGFPCGGNLYSAGVKPVCRLSFPSAAPTAG